MTARSFITALTLAAALTPLAASATVVIRFSMEEMTARAPLVVRARVRTSQAAWVNGSIWTRTTLVVTERLKGNGADTVVVKQPGGVVADKSQRVAGAAGFVGGEDVVLFLEPAADEKNVYVVLALAAGKVSLETLDGQAVAVRHLGGLSFADPLTRRIEVVEDLDRLGSADAFLNRIRAAAKGAPPPASPPVRPLPAHSKPAPGGAN